MGQHQSQDQTQKQENAQLAGSQQQIKIPTMAQMKQIASGEDIRYGEIKVMQSDSGLIFAVKESVFQDEKSWLAYKQKSELQISKLDDRFLIKLQNIQHSTQNEMCSSLTRVYSYYEYYPNDLKKDMQEIVEAHQQYLEIEVVAMLHCMVKLSSLISLQAQQISHGDLRPSTVFSTSPSLNNPLRANHQQQYLNPIYKITNIQELTTYNAYKRTMFNYIDNTDGTTLTLSPEQLFYLSTKNLKPSYDPYKSDVFCLGLVALEMATLQDIREIYDQQNYKIKPEFLEILLQNMKRQYSDQFCRVIEQMLIFQVNDRPDLYMAVQLLQPYQFQLEDYFQNSDLKTLSLTYSMDMNSIGNHQENASPPPRNEPQYKPVAQPLSNISNADPNVLLKQISLIDQKVKNALKKSQDAQITYFNSPIRRLKADRQQTHQSSNNLQQFTQLEPITSAHLQFSPDRSILVNDHQFESHHQQQFQQFQQPSNFVNSIQMQQPQSDVRNSRPPTQGQKQSLSLKHQEQPNQQPQIPQPEIQSNSQQQIKQSQNHYQLTEQGTSQLIGKLNSQNQSQQIQQIQQFHQQQPPSIQFQSFQSEEKMDSNLNASPKAAKSYNYKQSGQLPKEQNQTPEKAYAPQVTLGKDSGLFINPKGSVPLRESLNHKISDSLHSSQQQQPKLSIQPALQQTGQFSVNQTASIVTAQPNQSKSLPKAATNRPSTQGIKSKLTVGPPNTNTSLQQSSSKKTVAKTTSAVSQVNKVKNQFKR